MFVQRFQLHRVSRREIPAAAELMIGAKSKPHGAWCPGWGGAGLRRLGCPRGLELGLGSGSGPSGTHKTQVPAYPPWSLGLAGPWAPSTSADETEAQRGRHRTQTCAHRSRADHRRSMKTGGRGGRHREDTGALSVCPRAGHAPPRLHLQGSRRPPRWVRSNREETFRTSQVLPSPRRTT